MVLMLLLVIPRELFVQSIFHHQCLILSIYHHISMVSMVDLYIMGQGRHHMYVDSMRLQVSEIPQEVLIILVV